jgi:hypothetical protein
MPVAVVKALEGLVHKDSVMGELKIRECDHHATGPVFVVEAKKNDKYGIYPSFVEEMPNSNALLVPCGKTGCEPLMKS